MKRLLILVSLMIFASCTKDSIDLKLADGINLGSLPASIKLTKSQYDITEASNYFAFNLFNTIRQTGSDKTILISPFSAFMALGMAAVGADGETESQMRSVLGFDGVTKEEISEYYSTMLSGLAKADPYVDFKIANAILVDKNFQVKDAFIENVENSFESTVWNCDFNSLETLQEINNWAASKTEGTIKELLDHLDSSTKMALINALSFDGSWRYAFPKSTKGSFTNAAGRKVRTDVMNSTGRLRYANCDGWELLRLPYGTEAFCMYIVLPPAKEKFTDVAFEQDTFIKLFNSQSVCNVNMHIPSFIAQDSHELIDPLKALGMTKAFGDAAFPGISDQKLSIGKVEQKTFIDVNETGTKATAATAVTMVSGSNLGQDTEHKEPESVNFDADRPFYFIIRESSTNAILFIGQITDL